MFKQTLSLGAAIALMACSASAPSAEQVTPETETSAAKAEPVKRSISAQKIADGFYVLLGPGGNIGVSIGDDGVYMIDDKFDRFGEEIITTVAELTDAPIRYVLNTHFHGDHTGANAKMKATGATIMGHDNVRKRMGMSFENKMWNRTVEATDPSLWPVLTFSDTATLHFNGQTVKAIHVPSAHTDGDSLVHFEEANIIHMGDNFFLGMFPFVDVDGGGNLNGMIKAQETALALSDEATQIIPGHGPMASRDDLAGSIALLKTIRDRVQGHIDEGKTLEEIIAAKPLADMAHLAAFIKEDGMITSAYRSLNP